jgi:tRNA uridine 5-carboxymethylaminomethyl modification enzyme
VDNADERLTGIGLALGCIGRDRRRRFEAMRAELARLRGLLKTRAVTPPEAARFGLALNGDGIRRTAFQLLSYSGIGWQHLQSIWPDLAGVPDALKQRLEVDATYAVYLDRQQADIAAYRRDESISLVAEIDFSALPGLSNELKAKLELVRPRTLGQAARIEGMTPAAITLIAAHARRNQASEALVER